MDGMTAAVVGGEPEEVIEASARIDVNEVFVQVAGRQMYVCELSMPRRDAGRAGPGKTRWTSRPEANPQAAEAAGHGTRSVGCGQVPSRACHRLSQSRAAARDRTPMKLVAVFS